MANYLEFALNRVTEQLSLSTVAAVPFVLPDLFAGETVNLKVYLVAPNPSNGTGALKLLQTTGLSLKVGIGTSSGVLTSADLVQQSDNSFTGELSLAVAEIIDLFDASPDQPQDLDFEFQVSDNGKLSKAQFPIRIWKNILEVTTQAPIAPDVALTTTEAAEQYLPRRASIPGRGFELMDEDGSVFLVRISGGELKAEKLT